MVITSCWNLWELRHLLKPSFTTCLPSSFKKNELITYSLIVLLYPTFWDVCFNTQIFCITWWSLLRRGGTTPTFTTCPRRFIPVHEEFFHKKQTVSKNLEINQIESFCHHVPRFHMFVVSYYSCSNGSAFRQSFLKKIWRSKDCKIVRGSWTLQRIMVSCIKWVQYQDKTITSTRSLRCSTNTSEVNRTTNVSIWKNCSVNMKIYTYAQRFFIITCE